MLQGRNTVIVSTHVYSSHSEVDKSWADTTVLDVEIPSTDYEECQTACQVAKTTFKLRGESPASPAAGAGRVRGLDLDQGGERGAAGPLHHVLHHRGDHLLPGLCQEGYQESRT